MDEYQQFLPWLINEDIYVIPKESVASEDPVIQHPADQELTISSPQEANEINFKGNNRSKILILVSDPGADYLPDLLEDFLIKILQAIDLTIDDVALTNVTGKDLIQTMESIDHQVALIFNDDIDQLEFLRPEYYCITEMGGKKYLSSESLTTIFEDRSKKTKLWQQLKILFNK